jgi:chromosome segregation ATPase
MKGKHMPAQDERLDTVEFNLRQFKTETVKAYGDMAFEMTIIKGLTQDGITRLATLSNTVETRFEQVNIRLNGMDAHLETVGTHLENMDTRLNQLETKVDTIQTTLDKILEQLSKA